MPPGSPTGHRRRLALALIAPVLLLACALPTGPAPAAADVPPTPTDLPAAIEGLARYVPADSCDPTTKPGVAALGTLLSDTYGGTTYVGRTCGTDPLATSEHYEGRALDWMHSVHRKADRTEVKALLHWLFATDADHHRYANARRLGVMYVIWDNRIWGAYRAGDGWRAYNGCSHKKSRAYDTACHRDHVHFSLSWEGAQGHTSFWTKTVAPVDYGPCRPADLNWAPRYTDANPTPCPRYPTVKAPAHSSKTMKALVRYSGMELRRGLTGPVVKTVQKVVGAKQTSTFDAQTVKRVRTWQQDHDLTTSGVVTADTWRTLLADQAP